MSEYHGFGNTPTYRSWAGMIQRCTNFSDPRYKDYGGRGILVCNRWRSFQNFFKDMGNRPEGTTLDRIDNNGNYEPENCRWATPKEQSRNTSFNHLITHNGKTQSLVSWADETGINQRTLYARISRLGWSIEKALTVPTAKKRGA